MELDPNLAKHLFKEGAVLIIAGVPVKTEFGIDLLAYKIDENFRGIKMIPPGTHFVWCATQGLYGDSAPRVGFVHYFKKGEIVVREWDQQNEELRERKIADPELEKRRIRENLCELDRFLAPYDYNYLCDWKQLTDAVTEDTLKRCRPALGTIRTNIELQSCPDSERPRGVSKGIANYSSKLMINENDLLPNLKPTEGTAPCFTTLPDRIPKNSNPADVTRHSMDCIVAIDTLINTFSNYNVLLEEIQLSFAFFLIAHSVESLAHWRQILNMLSHSESAVFKHKLFFMKYSEILSFQLPYLPEELMAATNHNTVYKDVRELLVNLNIGGLRHSAERLTSKLTQAMGWIFADLLDEDAEDMPVVVEIS